MSANDDDDMDSLEQLEPTVLFTAADDSQQEANAQTNPKVEAFPMGFAPEISKSVFSSVWTVVTLITLLGGLVAGICTGAYKTFLDFVMKCLQLFQSVG